MFANGKRRLDSFKEFFVIVVVVVGLGRSENIKG